MIKRNAEILGVLVVLGLCPTLSVSAADKPVPVSWAEAVVDGKPMTSFRLRYETIEQDGKHADANALTMRSLVGWQTAPFHDFSIAAQLIDVGVFNGRYDNFDKALAEPGKLAYPRVVDPDDTDINQLFVEWSGIGNTKVRLGRQSLKLDNVRFIGNVEFRQVMQVFDGLALENRNLLPQTSLYLAHFERVKQITTKLQNARIEIANLSYHLAPDAMLTGYGYLIDWAGAVKAGNPNPKTGSSKTFGLRLDGAYALADAWKTLYTAEYARQDAYRDGLDNIDSHYLRLGGGMAHGSWHVRIDHEILSSNRGLSAFQTPLATGHLFQGWADQFLTTPNQGIRDTFVSFGGKLSNIQLLGEYHWINSDERFATPYGIGKGNRYGQELDLAISYTYAGNWMAKAEYARFREDDIYGNSLTAAARKRDTEKLWLTAMYTF